MSSPSKAWVTLLSLLGLAVLLYVVFKIKPDILGPIGGGVASARKPSLEIPGNPPARDVQETGSATQGSTRPEPGNDRVPVEVATKIVSGEVISYADDALVLRLQGGSKLKLILTEKTKISIALKAGKTVNVQYREEDGKKTAVWVQQAGPGMLAGAPG
jgi:hypothetical protein